MEGAFLVSAKKENGIPVSVKLVAEKGGECRIRLPFKTYTVKGIKRDVIKKSAEGISSFKTFPGQSVIFENGYE
jgi:alpha-L-fucosidase 2